MTCMYKDYKFKIKMVQEQWLQLLELQLQEATAGGFFRGGRTKFWLMWELPDFRLLLFKQTTYISRLSTRPEKWHVMLFSQSALIPQLYLHFFQKLKYYTFGKKDYSRKLFWVAVAINVNAKKVKGTVISLVKTRIFINAFVWFIIDC